MIPREVRHAVMLTALVVLLLALWKLLFVLLLGFFGVLTAILLRRPAERLAALSGLSVRPAMALVIAGSAALLAGFLLAIGPQLGSQFEQLWMQIPEAFGRLENWLGDREWGRILIQRFNSSSGAQEWSVLGSGVLGTIGGTVSTAMGVLANVVVVLSFALFLAFDPPLYRRGIIALVPPSRRERAGEVLHTLGEGLWRWLLGQLVDMVVVALMTGIGLWLIGVPLPLALGVFAGLMNFVPYVGAFIGAVPGLLVASGQSPEIALWTAGLYLLVQQVEGNVIMPLVQKHATAMPPALTILGVAAFGVLFGLLGVFLAAPLLVSAIILVRMLWIEDMLGDRSNPAALAMRDGVSSDG